MEIGISFGNEAKKAIRKEKGRSIIDFPVDFVILDIETTGLDSNFDSIIEIAAIKIENGVVVENFQSLVHIDFELDDFIIDLTGITDDMLATAPPLCDVLTNFMNFIGDSILIGHNVNFDINFLYDACVSQLNTPLKNDFIDTLRIARKLLKELPHHRLNDLCKHYNISLNSAHRAESDCLDTIDIYNAMFAEIEDVSIFKDSFNNHSNLMASSISTDKTSFSEDHPLFGSLFVFTGTLRKMIRKDAMQLVVDFGGFVGDGVTNKTRYLVLGNNDYCKTIKDGKSTKHKKADKLKLDGFEIDVISENTFYDMVSDN